MISLLRSALRLRYAASCTALFVGLGLLIVLPVQAQGNSSIAQGFQTKDVNVTSAALVSVTQNDPKSIELTSTDNIEHMVGIVSDKPLIELSGGESGVQIVTSGLTVALISDINGKVVNGDKITASPIEGVGMKATESMIIIGTAQGNLASTDTEARSVIDNAGKKRTVHIGLLPVQVGVSYFTVKNEKSTFVPGFLQELANNVGGRNVSPMRVLVAGLILLLLFISVTVLLYSAVRSSIISIGRNPLSESAVRKSLFEVGLTVGAVLLFSSLAIYLVLTA
jgi:hypothetical protein